MKPRTGGPGDSGREPVGGAYGSAAGRDDESRSDETASGFPEHREYIPSESTAGTDDGPAGAGEPVTSTAVTAVRPRAESGGPRGLTGPAAVISGDLLLTVDTPGGTTVEPCPPERRPGASADAFSTAGWEEPETVPLPALAPGQPGQPGLRGQAVAGAAEAENGPLLERVAECRRLSTLLAQGRSVRVTGPRGSGKSAVLSLLAASAEGLAPNGVVRLAGYRRTVNDLLQDLFAATAPPLFRGDGSPGRPRFRPDRAQLRVLLREVGAVVVIDDLECGGELLEELLETAPECAFLVSATPDVPPPVPDSRMEDAVLRGLSREGALRLLSERTGRPLTDEEQAWAADLWFESGGLPLRFVQAAAVLRHRDAARADRSAAAVDPEGPTRPLPVLPRDPRAGYRARGVPEGFAGGLFDAMAGPGPGGGAAADSGGRAAAAASVDLLGPLPDIADSAPPALRLAAGLGPEARRTLRLAAALGGECPAAPHLAALAEVGHGEAALRELVECGLATRVGTHLRLAEGVAEMLAGDAVEDVESVRTVQDAVRHFAWWTGHSAVMADQVSDEAEVLLAALQAVRDTGGHGAVVRLARSAAPCFALALRWSAWERTLRYGLEAARTNRAVAEEAWFHHELGVLAFCVGAYDRARAELESAVALRGALGDTRGVAAGRTVLELLGVSTAAQGLPAGSLPQHRTRRLGVFQSAGGGAGAGRSRSAGAGAGVPAPPPAPGSRTAPGAGGPGAPGAPGGGPDFPGPAVPEPSGWGHGLITRRNMAAAASGAVLLGALASVVALGAGTHGNGSDNAPLNVAPVPSASTPGQKTPGLSPSPSAPGSRNGTGNGATTGGAGNPTTFGGGGAGGYGPTTGPAASGTGGVLPPPAGPTSGSRPTTVRPTTGGTTPRPTQTRTKSPTPTAPPTTKPPTTPPPTTAPPTTAPPTTKPPPSVAGPTTTPSTSAANPTVNSPTTAAAPSLTTTKSSTAPTT
ncbi:ATP-binding protein [Phaeacidiphilus oryzae]|uniref:ATP-binding protein n=1 Tax=Phaeacidiphilus oryzae TaxID=348818 RepID=UPI00068EAC37|nr:ATP-binding protein [Phaeacidiphilus oryzae]